LSFFNELKRRNVFKVAIAYIVMAWLVMQVADVILNNITAPGWVFQVVLLLLGIGFLLALFFAWAFEMTPEGLKRESEVDRSQSITPQTGRKLNNLIFAVMALAIVYFAYDKFILSGGRDAALVEATTLAVTEQTVMEVAPAESDNSIAVLPFVNMSDDASNEFFSDGISEELLNLLAKIPELRVTSRSSAFAFKGKEIDIPAVAEKLGVAHILEGSVRKAGNKVRITAQLIEARSDTHLWSETYDRQLDDIFAIQDEIAATVVEQLKITLLGAAPKVQKTNPEAYALYLQARHLGRLNSTEGREQSSALYRQALAIDPDYAGAWDGLAINYYRQVGNGLVPLAEGYKMAIEAANKALAIDPDYARAHASLGYIVMGFDNDLLQAAQHLERALQLDPADTDIMRIAASLLQNLGRRDEAIALGEYITVRDPVNPTGHYNLGNAYADAGRWDAAIASYQTALRLSPDFVGIHYLIGMVLLLKGDANAALVEFTREKNDEEYRVKGMALGLYALGRQDEYQAKLAELIEGWGAEWPSEVAHVYAYSGEADAAFEWLDKAIGQNEEGLNEQFVNPLYAPLHDDPRWALFLERVGSSPEKLDAIEFRVTLPK